MRAWREGLDARAGDVGRAGISIILIYCFNNIVNIYLDPNSTLFNAIKLFEQITLSCTIGPV